MPEIKNNFTQGKMNKDLDERLIPNGQYRDAMNIEVSTSEGSDVGTVQNIKGNTSASILGSYNESCRCVGSIADEKNNKIYWFVHCSDRDAIIEYNSVTGESFFVLVDLFSHADVEEPFLKFTGKQITGINIIDDFLFWTDGDTEPKKVNIKRQKARQKLLPGSGLSFGHHSRLDVQGSSVGQIKEKHLTVIKRKPLHAPLVTTTSSVSETEKSIFKNIFPRFCYRYKYQDGEYSAFSPFTDIVFNPGYPIVPGEDGPYNSTTAFSTKEPYNTAMLNYISSVKISGFNRLDTPEDVVQVDILYKQENSNVIYSVASIKTTDPEWNREGNHQLSSLNLTSFSGYNATVRGSYNITTENINAALPEDQLLRPWDNVPKKALAQDVSGNRIVYGNYTQGYNIHSTPKLNSSIGLKPAYGDTVNPARSLKSLRDYQVGVVFGDKYGRETPVFTSDEGSARSLWKYPSGHYGASTPIHLESSVVSGVPDWADYFKYYVKHTSGEYYNLVMDRAYLPHTTSEVDNEDMHVWLSFASTDRNKLTADDYIIMKKSLGEEQQVTVENKYKILDIKNEAPAAIAYKFYTMGAFANTSPGQGAALTSSTSGIFIASPNDNEHQRIDRMTDTIHIHKERWLTEVNSVSPIGDGAPLTSIEETSDYAEEVKDLYMSWSKPSADGVIESQKYKITSVRVSNGNVYVCKLAKMITEPDALLAGVSGNDPTDSDATSSYLGSSISFKIERREVWSNENFSGKFFVKIAADDLVADQIISDTIDINQSANVVTTGQTFFWADRPVSSNETNGLVNSQNEGAIVSSYTGGDYDTPASIHRGQVNTNLTGNLTNTEVEWASLLAGTSGSGLVGNGNSSGQFGVFIDAMYFAGGNANADAGLSSLARESGQTILGNDTLNYPKMTWDKMGAIGAGSGVTYARDWGWRIPTQGSWEGTLATASFTGEEYTTYPYTWINTGSGRATISNATIGNADAQVNGMEGVITAGGPEVAGSAEGFRRFVEGSIYQDSRVSNIYGDIYTASGRHYMFISFAEPGVDLHDGSIPTSVEIGGFDGIAGYLQGIWGGGSFTNPDGSNFGDSDKWSIKMEDHLFTETTDHGINIGEGAPTAPGPNVTMTRTAAAEIISNTYNSNATSANWENTICSETLGYDTNYTVGNTNSQTAHEKQWDLAYGAYADAQVTINNFKARLAVNNRFRFAGDDSGEVYRILEVNKKHLYNHTTWRAGYRWDGTDWSLKGDSVEEAVVAWANHADADGVVNNTSGVSADDFETMRTRIENFGKQNNRRVCYIIRLDKDPRIQSYNPIAGSSSTPDIDTSTNIEFITPNATLMYSEITKSPMIWETEPSQAADLDIYYEASSAIPTRLTEENVELFMPRGSRVVFPYLPEAHTGCWPAYVREHDSPTQFDARRENSLTTSCFNRFHPTTGAEINYVGQQVRFYREDGSYTTGVVGEHVAHDSSYLTLGANGTRILFQIEPEVDASKNTGLSWYNCFTLRNGIESDRIRDGFNEMTITNGARVSATLEEPYAEEHRKSGLIYSGIYNSNSGVNNLNQFIQALKITKDLNPTYGSIQKLFSRSTDLVALCEDRVIKILANKDAVYNADGNPQLIASANVLGQATPFVGDFGISKNPESFASESYRAYFTDASRGAVLRLSMDGLTPISDAGMNDYFRDNLGDEYAMYLGSYDNYKKQYNLTIKDRKSDNVIQNSFINTGVDLVEEIPAVNIMLNSDVSGGSDYTAVDIDNDIWDGGYGLPYSTAQASFNHTTTIRNHPAIEVGDAQAYYEGVTGVSFEDSVFEATSTQLEFRIFGDSFTAAGSVGQNPFDGWTAAAPTPGTGSGRPRAFIERNLYLTGSQSPTSSAAYFQYGGNENVPYDLGDGYPSDSTTPNSTNVGPWYDHTMFPPGHDGVTLVSQIDYPSIYLENGDSVATPTGYDRTTAWQGITFRNLNAHPTDGNASALIRAPRAWTDPNSTNIDFDADAEVPQAVKDEYPSATNNTIFNGEEIRVKLAVALNNYSPTHKVHVRIALFDGNSSISGSLVHIPSGGSLPYGDTATDTGLGINDENSWIKGFQDNAYVNWPILGNALTTGGYQHSCYFKFTDGTSNEGIVVDNLRVHVHAMVTEDDTATTSGYEKSELVVREIIIDKRYRLNTPGVDEVAAVPALADVPAVTVPAWAEVIHNAPEGWTTSNALTPDGTPSQNLTYGAEQIYGVANPGSTVTEYGVSYYSGNNNALTVYGQYPGSAVNGEEYTEVVQDIEWNDSDILLDYAITSNGNATSSHIRMDLAPEDYYVEGNWYLVDVYYDPNNSINAEGGLFSLYCPGVLGNSQDVHDARMVNADHTSGHEGYPDFHYGFINGGSNVTDLKHMALTPTVRTEYGTSDLNVLRTIFQYKANENGELYHPGEFRLHAWNFKGVIKSVYRLDITQSPTMTEPTDWNTPDANYVGPHAFSKFIHENTVYRSGPDVYYKNGMLCWNTNLYTYQYWSQTASGYMPDEPSNDGYKFAFTVAQAPDPNDPNGGNLPMAGNLRARVTNSNGDYGNTFAGFTMHNIIVPGDYIVLGNFNADEPTILQQPVGSNMVVNSVESSPLTSAASTGHADKITFSAGTGGVDELGFTGAVHSVSLTDATNYFTGGTVDSWTFSGFDTGLENWIVWDSLNQRISFNDAPGWGGNQTIDGVTTAIQANQRVFQHLPNFEPQIGDSYLIEFDYYITSGSISGYYYSSTTDQGFNLPGNLSSIDENGNDLGVLRYSAVHTIGDDQPTQWSQLNALTITMDSHLAYGDGPTNGWVDNFVMQQAVSPSVDITTVSFSEDVKGWTSFKSFIPDSGVSVSNNYYTMKKGGLWKHYDNEIRNSFYNLAGESKSSSINVILNQSPSSVKSFKTLNYEGSQGMVPQFVTSANGISNRRIDNITGKQGWEVESVTTDLQKGSINEFIKKEGKWFNYIKGASDKLLASEALSEDMYNSQIANISFQGLGIVSQVFINSSATEATTAE